MTVENVKQYISSISAILNLVGMTHEQDTIKLIILIRMPGATRSTLLIFVRRESRKVCSIHVLQKRKVHLSWTKVPNLLKLMVHARDSSNSSPSLGLFYLELIERKGLGQFLTTF